MEILQIFFKNDLRNFSYLLHFNDGTMICIDPFRADEICQNLSPEQKINIILNTHDHHDHISGNQKLSELFNIDIYAHYNSKIPNLKKKLKNQDIIFKDQEFELISLESPGHTSNHLMFLLKKNNSPFALFTGDCFFNAGVGNCYNGGNVKDLYNTTKKYFSTFPDELLIYPGHEYLKRNLEFTLSIEYDNVQAKQFLNNLKNKDLNQTFFINNLKTEREINMFLRLNSKTINKHLGIANDEEKVFIQLRELRNIW